MHYIEAPLRNGEGDVGTTSTLAQQTTNCTGATDDYDVPTTPNVSLAETVTHAHQGLGNKKVVVLTGVVNFLPSHILNVLLTQEYTVRGIISCDNSMEDFDDLFTFHPRAKNNLFIHQVMPSDQHDWERAFESATYVIHTVIATHHGSAKPDCHSKDVDVIKKIMAASVNARTIQRVVLITSVASIAWSSQSATMGNFFNEDNWENEENLTGYARCQLACEKAAWNFINCLTEADKIELVVLNPAFMLGPVIQGKTTHTMGVIKAVMESTFHALPESNLPVVDARDVAHAAAVALVKSGAVGNRHILCGGSIWLEEMSAILDREFTKQGYRVLTEEKTTATRSSFCGLFRKQKAIVDLGPLKGRTHISYDNTRMRKVLGLEPHCPEETIIETAYSLIHWDMIRKTARKNNNRSLNRMKYDATRSL